MPNRIVRDAILDSPRYHGLSSDTARLLFFELLLLADDYGLTPAYPLFLSRRTAAARRASDEAITKIVAELADHDLVRVYMSGGQAYAYIPRFGNWPRAQKTKWPMPPAELGGNEIKDLQKKRSAKAAQLNSGGSADAPETETETEFGTDKTPVPAAASAEMGLPSCPHQKLIALFSEKVPELPRPKPELWDGKAAEAMRARWKWALTSKREDGSPYAVTGDEGLAWFGKFFDRVAHSDFLTGRDGVWTRCNLAWLMKAENFKKVVEGNYTNRETA
jgi:hypothetical protein